MPFIDPFLAPIVKRAIDNLHSGNEISDSDLIIASSYLPSVVELLDVIDRREYDLFTNELRRDMKSLNDMKSMRNIKPT